MKGNCVIEKTCMVTSLHLVSKLSQKSFFCTFNLFPSFNKKKVPNNLNKFLRELGNEIYTFYHWYPLQIKPG